MKKVIVIGLATIMMFAGCNALKKTLKKTPTVNKYTNEAVCMWLKPVNIDTSNIYAEITYLIEGLKPNGSPVLVFAKGDITAKIMELEFDQILGKDVGSYVRGNVFTCNNLGLGAILTEQQIVSGKYSPQQYETLRRDAKTEKYELRSFLPIRATGKIIADSISGYKITMVTQEGVPLVNKSPAIESIQPNQNQGKTKVEVNKSPQKETNPKKLKVPDPFAKPKQEQSNFN